MPQCLFSGKATNEKVPYISDGITMIISNIGISDGQIWVHKNIGISDGQKYRYVQNIGISDGQI